MRRPRRHFLLGAGALLATPFRSFSQPAQKMRRIGYLSPGFPSPGGSTSRIARTLQEALGRAGYEEGKNLIFEARYAKGKAERLAGLAEELVRLEVELIVAATNSASDAARRATRTLPIVMLANMFPVERGLAASLARPGGNVTGTVWWAQPQDSVTKLYQLLKEAVPSAKRSANITNPADPQIRFYDLEKLDRMRAGMGLSHTRITMTRPEDLEAVLDQLKASGAEVLYVGAAVPITSRWREIAAFAIAQRMVSISDVSGYLNDGGLLSYGPDWTALVDRTVSYVDRILRGAKPGDLPIEQASKYEMVLNAKTARAIGFKPPASFMVQVDRVIE
jgi:putative ABC transport system substrate-binding protein